MRTTKAVRKPRVLVVEDDRDISAVISLALEDLFDLHVAASPDSAKCAIRAEQFDLVLLDWRLGDACGSEVLEEISLVEAALRPQVIVTSGGDDESLQKALQSGEFYLLPKPYQFVDLIKTATRLLSRGLTPKATD